jgi:hypothetical protein
MNHFLDEQPDLKSPFLASLVYAEPRVRPERPHYTWLQNQCKFFHEHHRTDRWNLRNPLDAFQLYYTIDILGFNAFELAMMLQRDQRYKESHRYWAVYDFARATVGTIFPYKDGSAITLEQKYRQMQRLTAELEEKRGMR